MKARLFTSPIMKAEEVKLWCQMVRDNKGKVTLFELELKSALKQKNAKKAKAAS